MSSHTLTPADLALHAALGIPADLLERMLVRRVTDREARDVLALNGFPGRLDGLLYPYLDPEHRRVVTHRLRRDHPEFEHGKPKNKYVSGYGDRRHCYFGCANADALADVRLPVVVVEAEKSVLAVLAGAERITRAVVVLGLGGCWGWRGRVGKVETPTGGHADEVGPLPDFDRLAWADRDVVVIFDANASTNRSVQAARRGLSVELARRGARIRILDLQPEDGVNGPDDVLGRYGAARFFADVDAAPAADTFDVIYRLNRQHAVVREGGKTIVITETHDPVLKRDVLIRSSFADFRNFYLRESMRVGVDKKTSTPIWKPLGHAWLTHRDRRQYDGVVMSPDRDVPGYLNLWRGFAVTPQAGSCSRYKEHLYETICAGNTANYDYLWSWLAYGVQHPERPAEVAVALRGLRGTGKGLMARPYGELFGQHYLQIANARHLTGNFNAHLQDTVVLFADEAFWAGDKAGESVLKMLITEPVIPIERKGHDVVLAKNLLHLILASNHDWIVPAGIDERRFCVLDVDPGHQHDRAYFAALVEELETGGRAALLYDLLHHPLGDVDLRTAPATEALREQKVLSLDAAQRWLFDKLMTGHLLPDQADWECQVPKDALHGDYVLTLQKIGIDRRRTETELGMFINKILGETVKTSRPFVGSKRRRVWTFPTLTDCRMAFDRVTGSHHPWPKASDEGEG